jgi:hypothetical protein
VIFAAIPSTRPFDFRPLKTKFPYIMLIPQTKFLEFITTEASKYARRCRVCPGRICQWAHVGSL